MPKPQKAPEWIKFPKLVIEENVLKLEYQLSLIQEQDCSDIIWKRERDGRFWQSVTENRADSIDCVRRYWFGNCSRDYSKKSLQYFRRMLY